MKLVIITGLPGAGKSEAAKVFQSAGYPVIVMGDVIREEAKNKRVVASPINTRAIMLGLRKLYGADVIATRCAKKLGNVASELAVIDGCKSLTEINTFKLYAKKITTICIYASPITRFNRVRQRRRDDNPLDWATFTERDHRELSVGLGEVIALGDIMVVNESSIEEFRAKMETIVRSFRK